MAYLAPVNQTSRIFAEATPGTNPGTGGRQLLTTRMPLSPDGEVNRFKPQGFKYPAVTAYNREWATIAVEGMPTYPELSYLFCGIFQNVTPVLTGTLVRTWTFAPSSTAKDTIKTFSLEEGETGNVRKATFCHLNELSMSVARNEVTLGGTMIGQRLNVTAANTFGTLAGTALTVAPVLPTHANLYLDTTSAGLGATQLTQSFMSSFNITGRQVEVWPINRANTSFAAIVEGDPTFSGELVASAANDAGQAGTELFTEMRAGTRMYLRWEFISDFLIENVTTDYFHSLTVDMAVTFGIPSALEDRDGVFAITWPYEVVHDAGWSTGKAYNIILVNDLATL